VVSGGGGAYLISGNSGGTTVATVEEVAANVTHATRVSQATVSPKKRNRFPAFHSLFSVLISIFNFLIFYSMSY